MLCHFCFYLFQSPLFHFNRIVVGHNVNSNYIYRLYGTEQFKNKIISDKSCCTCYEYRFACQVYFLHNALPF